MPTRNSCEPGCLSPVSEHVLEVGARLENDPSELLIQTAFKKELDDQAGLFEAMSLADLAHTLVMMDADIVPIESGCELLTALLKLHERPADFHLDPSRGDLYTNREAWLSTQARASAWLGAGRAPRSDHDRLSDKGARGSPRLGRGADDDRQGDHREGARVSHGVDA
jgi:argininosuccinate lyase